MQNLRPLAPKNNGSPVTLAHRPKGSRNQHKEEKWEAIKPTIMQLFIQEKKTADQVVVILKNNRTNPFVTSRRQLFVKLKEWGLNRHDKNRSNENKALTTTSLPGSDSLTLLRRSADQHFTSDFVLGKATGAKSTPLSGQWPSTLDDNRDLVRSSAGSDDRVPVTALASTILSTIDPGGKHHFVAESFTLIRACTSGLTVLCTTFVSYITNTPGLPGYHSARENDGFRGYLSLAFDLPRKFGRVLYRLERLGKDLSVWGPDIRRTWDEEIGKSRVWTGIDFDPRQSFSEIESWRNLTNALVLVRETAGPTAGPTVELVIPSQMLRDCFRFLALLGLGTDEIRIIQTMAKDLRYWVEKRRPAPLATGMPSIPCHLMNPEPEAEPRDIATATGIPETNLVPWPPMLSRPSTPMMQWEPDTSAPGDTYTIGGLSSNNGTLDEIPFFSF